MCQRRASQAGRYWNTQCFRAGDTGTALGLSSEARATLDGFGRSLDSFNDTIDPNQPDEKTMSAPGFDELMRFAREALETCKPWKEIFCTPEVRSYFIGDPDRPPEGF
jgi:hypothetical protein